MLKTLTLMLLGASALAAQKLPQIAEGTWKFAVQPSSASGPWTALLQVRQTGSAVSAIFITSTGAAFPGFNGAVSGDAFGGAINIAWDATNRDVPGYSIPFVGAVSPDGTSMRGTWTLAYPSQVYVWSAAFIPPSVPVVSTPTTSPTVAACTAAVQNTDAGTITLSGFRCLITPPSGAAGLQFVGDSGTAVVTGNFQQPAPPTIAAATIRRE